MADVLMADDRGSITIDLEYTDRYSSFYKHIKQNEKKEKKRKGRTTVEQGQLVGFVFAFCSITSTGLTVG